MPIAEYPLDPNRLIWTEDAELLWERIIADQSLGKDFNQNAIGADDSVGTIDEPTDEPTDSPTDEPTDEPTVDPDEAAAAEAQAQARLQAGLCA